MKTISDYTIYCTEEQTKKAIELGAPIRRIIVRDEHLPVYFTKQPDEKGWAECPAYYIPTAEQMIGWLEEQGINIVIRRFFAKWAFKLEQLTSVGEKNLHIDSIEIPSRKKAILAAIDAALDYLIKNKK